MRDKRILVHITSGTVVATLFLLLFGWLLYEIRGVLLIVVSAIIFSMALAPAKRFLSRFRIPEPISVVILYLFVFLLFAFFLYSLLPVVIQQYQTFLDTLPNIVRWLQSVTAGTVFEGVIAEQSLSVFTSSPQPIAQVLQDIFRITGTGIFSAFGGLVNVTLFLLLTFLFAVNQRALDEFLSVVTPTKYRTYVEDLWSRTKVKVGQWFQGQMLLVFIIGVLTYFALLIIGVPNALFLAIFAGVMEVIPIFGPVLGAIPAVLMALTTGDVTMAFLVVLVFIIIQQFENNLIYPLVVTKVVGISSILVILAVVIGGLIAGFIGVIIAVPLAAVVQEIFSDIRSGKLQALRESEGQ